MTKNTLEAPKIQGISIESAGYPQVLKKLADTPPVLYVKGDSDCLNLPTVAVVGTRTPSQAGLESARKMGRMFAELGFIVVSGLARGCDTAAHEGCLEAGGTTIAVLAHGLDQVYPAENKKLAERICHRGGCLVSEHASGIRPRPALFVRRNRIITGLASLVLAVEPGTRGGTARAIRFARQQRKACTIW